MATLVITALAAGCASPASPVTPSAADTSASSRPTVVALIDSGINPYHEVFAAKDESIDFGAFAPNVTNARLASQGDYSGRASADGQFWAGVQEGQLYGFDATRLLAVSFADKPKTKILDSQGHGTGTASLVAKYDPSAIIVMVQIDGDFCVPPTSCLSDPSTARGLAWAASQPWIDVISISLGLPLDMYDPAVAHPEAKAFVDATRLAAASGKVVIVGSGNDVGPTLESERSGPPWVIAVGGVHLERHAEATQSNKMVDVVANFTAMVANSGDVSNFTFTSGTSFSTPTVAAAISQSIAEVRSAVHQKKGIENGFLVDGVLPSGAHFEASNKDFRRALNASARLWSTTEWNPTANPVSDPVYLVFSPATPIVAAPVQMGWGYVDSTLAPIMAQRVLAHDFDRAPSPADAYMQAYASLREAMWQ